MRPAPLARCGTLLFLLAATLLPAALAAEFRPTIAGWPARVGVHVDGTLHWAETAPDGGPAFPAAGLAATWSAAADGTVSATVRNTTDRPRALGRFIVAQLAGVPGDRALVMSGWQLTNTVQPVVPGKKLVSKTLLQL